MLSLSPGGLDSCQAVSAISFRVSTCWVHHSCPECLDGWSYFLSDRAWHWKGKQDTTLLLSFFLNFLSYSQFLSVAQSRVLMSGHRKALWSWRGSGCPQCLMTKGILTRARKRSLWIFHLTLHHLTAPPTRPSQGRKQPDASVRLAWIFALFEPANNATKTQLDEEGPTGVCKQVLQVTPLPFTGLGVKSGLNYLCYFDHCAAVFREILSCY